MNTLAIKRIAWKEFRQQSVFFVAMVIITFVVSAIVYSIFRGVAGSEQWPMMTTGIFAALFGAACGGTLFATEKEEGTFLNLQLMPLTGRTLMIGKVGTAYLMTLAFFVLCLLFVWLSGTSFNISYSNEGNFKIAIGMGEFFLHFGLMVTEFFAWSLLFSLLLSRPLVASILGIVGASLVIQIVSRLTNGFVVEPYQLQTYISTLGPRAVLVISVLAVNAIVANRWLQIRKTERRPWKLPGSLSDTSRTRRETSIATERAWIPNLRVISRFVWQAYRTSWPYMLVYIVLVPIAAITGILALSAGVFCVVGAIAGSLAFTSDKTANRAAFLAIHGERPAAYFLGHSLAWLSWIVFVNFAFLALFLVWIAFNEGLTKQTAFLSEILSSGSNPTPEIMRQLSALGAIIFASTWWTLGALFGCVVGQLCSLLIDKRLLATLAAALVSVPAAIWLLLIYASDTPLWWTVFPVLAGLLFTGYLATKWWLGNGRSVMRVSGLVLFVLAFWGVISGAVLWQRSHEIPVMPLDFADSRAVATEEDSRIVNEIRVRMAKAFEGFNGIDQPFYSEIEQVMPKMLEARQLGQTEFYLKAMLEKDINLGAAWDAFSELNPKDTIESQLAIVKALIADNHLQLEHLDDELQFAVDHISSIQSMPPWLSAYDAGPLAIVAAPIQERMFSTDELISLSFYQAALDGKSHETWLALKRMLWLQTLASQTYGLEMNRDHFVSLFNTWLSLGIPEPNDLREALACSQQEWFLLTDPLRVGEAFYLTAKARAGQNLDLWKSPQATLLQLIYDWIPSERIRTNQLIELVFAYEASPLQYQLNNEYRPDLWRDKWEKLLGKDSRSRLSHWVDSTILPREAVYDNRFSISKYSNYKVPQHNRNNYWTSDSRIRCEILVLKLGAMVWQLDNGSMPSSTEELKVFVGTRRPSSIRYPYLVDDKWYSEYILVSNDHTDSVEIKLDDNRRQAYDSRFDSESTRVPRIVTDNDN